MLLAKSSYATLCSLIDSLPDPPANELPDPVLIITAQDLDAMRTNYHTPTDPDDWRKWRRQAEYYARLFEHPKTPEAFKRALDRIFSDYLMSLSGTPDLMPFLRVLWPLVMEDLEGNAPATMDSAVSSIRHLAAEFVPDSINETIWREIYREGGEG